MAVEDIDTCDKTTAPDNLVLSPSVGRNEEAKCAAVRVNTSATLTTKGSLTGRSYTTDCMLCLAESMRSAE